MRVKYKKMSLLYKAIVLITVVCLTVYACLAETKPGVVWILLLGFLILIGVMFLYNKWVEKRVEKTFVQLSELLTNLIDGKVEEVFPVAEDTLLSKLQHQTLKLTDILVEKNKQIENDRDEIKALVSDIAHQLKTPLTNLKLYLELIQEEKLPEERRREFMESIVVSASRLGFLIESMIKMSRLESDIIQLKLHRKDLSDTLLLAIHQVQKKARARNMEIRLDEIDKVQLPHDKNWLSEAFFNILENAVKYSYDNGVVYVTVQSYEMFSRVDIKDNGIGISEQELPRIFLRFYRGQNVGEAEGIGIGLYLAREIIMKHGGYMKVCSGIGGSTFSVFLPSGSQG